MSSKLRSVRDGSVEIAKAIIAETGLEGLSLREVARRLGVSHGAPYRHFPSRDHLLAEVIRRAYEDFAAVLRQGSASGDPDSALAGMGRAYVLYALDKPLEYRLMFGTTLPDPAIHIEMMQSADQALSLLKDALAKRARPDDRIDEQALFVWASLHGLVTILSSDVARAMRIRHSPASAASLVLEHLSRTLAR